MSIEFRENRGFAVGGYVVNYEQGWNCSEIQNDCYAQVWESKPDVCDAGHEQPVDGVTDESGVQEGCCSVYHCCCDEDNFPEGCFVLAPNCAWCGSRPDRLLASKKAAPMVEESFGGNHFCTDCFDEAREILLDIVLSMPLEVKE